MNAFFRRPDLYEFFTEQRRNSAASLFVDFACARPDGNSRQMPSSVPKIMMCALMPVLTGLCACAIPPALTIVSLATNAVSYAATGKSVSDHGISAIVGEDCALWRVVADRKICTPDSAAPADRASGGAEAEAPEARGPADGGTGEKAAEPARQVAAAPNAGRFLVLGAFINQTNAQHFAASVEGMETAIVAVSLYGATFYRVVAGPLDDTGVRAVRERMALMAAVPPWEITEPRAKSDTAANSVTTPATPTARRLTTQNVIAATLPSPLPNSAPVGTRD
jgi:hypothetical protein